MRELEADEDIDLLHTDHIQATVELIATMTAELQCRYALQRVGRYGTLQRESQLIVHILAEKES